MKAKGIQFRIEDSVKYELFRIYDSRLKESGFGSSDDRRYSAFIEGAKSLLGDFSDSDSEDYETAMDSVSDSKTPFSVSDILGFFKGFREGNSKA